MATYAELKALADRYTKEIARRGGPAKAPGFADLLAQVNTQITGMLPAGFDANAYLQANPDVAKAGVDPIEHYLSYGKFESRAIVPGGPSLDQNGNAIPVQQPPVAEQPPVTQPPVVEQPPVTQPPVVEQPPVQQPPTEPELPPTLPPVLGTDQNPNSADNGARPLPNDPAPDNSGAPGPDGTGGNVGDPVKQGNPLADTVDTSEVENEDDKEALERFKDLFGVGEKLGRSLASEFYAPGSLGRMEEQLSPEERDALLYLRQQAASAGARTPQEQAALDNMRQRADQAFQQTPEMQELIARQLAYEKIAGDFTPLEQEAINNARNALGGLSAPENTAIREQARRGINQEYAGQLMALQKIQAANQVRGAAAGAQFQQLGQGKVQSQRMLEQDILAKNIEEKRLARESFNNLVGQRTDAASSRKLQAGQNAANTMVSDFSARQAAGTGLLGAYGSQLTTQRKIEGDERNAANELYTTGANRAGDTLRGISQYNLSQLAAEKAGQIGSIFGGIGAATQQAGLIRGEMFAEKSFEEMLAEYEAARKFEAEEAAKNRKSNEKIAGMVN